MKTTLQIFLHLSMLVTIACICLPNFNIKTIYICCATFKKIQFHALKNGLLNKNKLTRFYKLNINYQTTLNLVFSKKRHLCNPHSLSLKC